MEHLQLLTRALQYIEENLQGSLKTEDVAAYCYCSKSSIEKLFKNVNNISVHDYVVRRKMVIAAGKLQKEDVNILHLALSLGISPMRLSPGHLGRSGTAIRRSMQSNTVLRSFIRGLLPYLWREQFL